MQYIRAHWRGELSLPRSFGINFLILLALVEGFGVLIFQLTAMPSFTQFISLCLHFLLFRIILYPWQVTGLLRCCDRVSQDYRQKALVRIAQAAIVGSLLLVAGDGLNLIRNWVALEHAEDPPYWAYLLRPRDYTLSIEAAGTVLRLQGDLDFGATRDVRSLLQQHAGLRALVINSNGGPVYEGRGVGALATEYRLITYSETHCLSSCVSAFMGGQRRYLAPGASLGFHQYHLDARNVLPYLDLEKEQQKDIVYFRQRGIGAGFLEKIFDTPHGAIWKPSQQELLDAGVVDVVIEPDRFLQQLK